MLWTIYLKLGDLIPFVAFICTENKEFYRFVVMAGQNIVKYLKFTFKNL